MGFRLQPKLHVGRRKLLGTVEVCISLNIRRNVILEENNSHCCGLPGVRVRGRHLYTPRRTLPTDFQYNCSRKGWGDVIKLPGTFVFKTCKTFLFSNALEVSLYNQIRATIEWQRVYRRAQTSSRGSQIPFVFQVQYPQYRYSQSKVRPVQVSNSK